MLRKNSLGKLALGQSALREGQFAERTQRQSLKNGRSPFSPIPARIFPTERPTKYMRKLVANQLTLRVKDKKRLSDSDSP